MTKELLRVVPDYDELKDNCPITSAIAEAQGNLSFLTPLEDEFVFPENKDGLTPFYCFSESEVTAINIASEQVYNTLVDSLDFLFSPKYKHLIPKFFGAEFINAYPEFVDYAIHTFEREDPAIYGRFDIAYDFEKKKILGFYEGNLDTPTMYYDSVVMQHHLLTRLGREEEQFNLHQESLTKTLDKVIGSPEKARLGFLCDTDITEDAITVEMLHHAVNDNSDYITQMADINTLKYDFGSPREPKFTLNDIDVTHIFALYPWESMVEDFYRDNINPMKEWEKWTDKIKFMEPAWRWFVSNKGVWAWLTYLKEVLQYEDKAVSKYVADNKESWEYIIPSYVDKPEHLKDYIMKPLQGRMSNNILFYRNNELIHETKGYYSEDDFIYQEIRDTTSADNGKTKAIVCSWLAPWEQGDKMDMQSVGIAVREFTGDVLRVSEERFVPHIMKIA